MVWLLAAILFLAPSNAPKKVVVIPLHGTVDYVMFSSLKRRLELAKRYEPDIVVIEVDTYGGYVVDAERIVSLLERHWGFDVVAYVGKKALSAGAYICLACDGIVMAPTATLGDCMPILAFGTVDKELAEKARSPLRAKFAALAKRNNYPQALAVAMVDPSIEALEVVVRMNGKQRRLFVTKSDYDRVVGRLVRQGADIVSERVVVPAGKLLTMDGEQAKQFGFARFLAPSLDAALRRLNAQTPVVVLSKSWWEHIISFINWGPIVALLLIIAGIGVYIEVTHPGMMVPGAVGVGCLAIVLLSSYLAGLAAVIEIILIVAGIVLLLIEVFLIPGFGVAGLIGAALVVLGGFLLLQPFVLPQNAWEMEVFKRNMLVLGSSVVGVAVAVFLLSQYLPKSRAFGRLFVVEPPDGMSGAAALEERTSGVKVGDVGRTITPLRPSGKAIFASKPLSVVTEGEFLDEGVEVEVVAVSGNRIVVRKRG